MSRLSKKDQQLMNNIRIQRKRNSIKSAKLDSANYYNGNHLFSYEWAVFYLNFVWAMEHIITAKLKRPDKVEIFWCRLTEEALKGLKDKDGSGLVDAGIRSKFSEFRHSDGAIGPLDFKVIKDKIYYGRLVSRETKKGDIKIEFQKEGDLATFMALSTFFNRKGKAMFDQNYDGKYYIILDEMNREKGEVNRFSIIKAFTNQLETALRNADLKNIKIICIGNNTVDVPDILRAFNFMPPAGKYGIWKLKRRRCLIEVIKPSEFYEKTKLERVGALLSPDDERYKETQEFAHNELIARAVDVREREPQYVVRFSKTSSDWFCVNKGHLITKYNKEQKPHYGIFRHLDCTYQQELVNNIQFQHDNMAFKFDNESTCMKWMNCMAKLRAK